MNRMFAAAFTGLALSLATVAAGPAFAYAPDHGGVSLNGARIDVAIVTPLPMRYFCAQNPAECRGGGPSRVTMSPDLATALNQVNRQVNRAIRPKRDVVETWSLNPSRGDCNDYVMSKRSALMRMGVPAAALRIAITRTRSGEPHAVLIVRTSEGDFVLDNLTNTVKTVSASGYSIRAMSSSNPLRWTAAG